MASKVLCGAWRSGAVGAAHRAAAIKASAGRFGCRTLTSRTFREGAAATEDPKPPFFPYWEKEFTTPVQVLNWERTVSRLDEQSKLIIVEGADCIGKTKFAEELAKEFDFICYPEPNMDEVFITPYGNADLREYKDYLMPKVQPYDEADFARDPLGPVEGCADRLMFHHMCLKFKQYVYALRHILNTGQGVVLEKSPFSHYTIGQAMVNAGWIQKPSLGAVKDSVKWFRFYLPRPNLIIYLDAPPEVTQQNIKARGYECDKNSPVWSNTQYLLDKANYMKRDYLKKCQDHSEVLVYDWSEPGDTEIVVEDIERLNLDYFGIYDEKQSDWRFNEDEEAAVIRKKVSCRLEMQRIFEIPSQHRRFDADHLHITTDEAVNLSSVTARIKGNRYQVGFNPDMGESVMFKMSDYQDTLHQWNFVLNCQTPWPENDTYLEPSNPKPVLGK